MLLAVLYYRQPVLEMLSLLIIMLPVMSYFVTKSCFERIDADISFSAPESRKKIPAKLHLTMHNPTLFPLLHIECLLTAKSSYYQKGEKTTYVLPAPASGDASFSASVEFYYCGCFEAKIAELRCCDYLYLWSFSKSVHSRSQIMIYPDQKMELEMAVKNNVASATRQFFVLLELYRSDEHPEYLDHAIEHAYAASRELLAHLENFLFAFYSAAKGEFCSFPIRNETDLKDALGEAYYETPYDDPHLGQSIYQRSGMQKGCLIVANYEGVDKEVFET
jgi:hypothetical protein